MSSEYYVLTYLLIAVVGLAVGSFVNVVIARVPEGRSIVRPASACPSCGHELRRRDNIPVVSYVLLHGACRDCRTHISMRYPVVELANTALWLALTSWALTSNHAGLLPLLLVLGSACIALFCIDLDTHRLPNAIVLWLYPITATGLVLAGVLGGEWPWLSALAGAALWLAVFGLVWLISGGRGLGLGDVKLAPVLGATLGWIGLSPAVVGLFATWVLGGSVAIALIVTGRAKRGTHLAFGPFMILGGAVAIWLGADIANWYLGANGLT